MCKRKPIAAMKISFIWLVLLLLMAGCQSEEAVSPSPIISSPFVTDTLLPAGASYEDYPFQAEFWRESHDAVYSNRGEYLTALGLKDATPFYLYYDEAGVLQLELYYDQENETGFMLRYSHDEGREYINASNIVEVTIEAYQSHDPYYLGSIYGDNDVELVTEYKQVFEYNEQHQIEYCYSEGYYDDVPFDVPLKIVEIQYQYRENDKLLFRYFMQNSRIFGTMRSSGDYFYDEMERLIFEESYITHGSLEYYPIYMGDEVTPTYYLNIDFCPQPYATLTRYDLAS